MQFQASEKETKSRCSGGMRSNMPRASAQRPAGAHIEAGTLVLRSRKLQKSFHRHLKNLYELPTGILYHLHRFTLLFLDKAGHLEPL